MRKILNRDNAYSFTDDELMTEFSHRLHALRMSSCLSQEEFAKQSGISRSTIKRIESGQINDISLRTLIKLLRAGGMMDGLGDLIEIVPVHPAIRKKEGVRDYVSSKMKLKYG